MDNIKNIKSEFPENKGQISKPLLVPNVSTHDFGEIDGTITHTYDFVLTNGSTKNIVVIGAAASCGCTQPTFTQGEIVEPGKSTTITANYKAIKAGQFHKWINVTYNYEIVHNNKALTQEQKNLTKQVIRLDIKGDAKINH